MNAAFIDPRDMDTPIAMNLLGRAAQLNVCNGRNKELLSAIKIYVENLFNRNTKPWLLYHNLSHTQQVVRHAEEIAAYYSLDEDKLFVLLAAAWFHDTGYLVGEIGIHEESGVQLMRAFLNDYQVQEKIQDNIARCIMATKWPVKPLSLLEQILCDADTYNLGTSDFSKTDPLVWQELELGLHKTFDNHAQRSLQFLQQHTFFTSYCQQLLNQGKKANMKLLEAVKGVV